MNSFNYWRTQWVLKKKWFLNKWLPQSADPFQAFVILCDARTGSTWLHTLLNSSPEIQSYGEVLSEREASRGLHDMIWKPHTASIKAVGCKIFYQQLQQPKFTHILDEITTGKSIRIIDLRRENHLEMYVSLKVAEETNKWSSTRKNATGKVKIRVDFEEFESFVEDTIQGRAGILNQLKDHDVLKVTYESIVDDTHKELKRIQEFLGVCPKKLFSLITRQNTDHISKIVKNYDELVLHTLKSKRKI